LPGNPARGGGFTLVEVIVVIVIIAILAAIGVPALTGYIDKAHARELLADGHNLQVALQTIGGEVHASGKTIGTSEIANAAANIPNYTSTTTFAAEILVLTGKDYTGTAITKIKYTSANAITYFIYTSGGKTVTYDAGDYTIS
jgi:type IV pilus assembly protein PilA